MKVPLLDLQAQNGPLESELKDAFERVLKSGRYILGPEVESLEAKVATMADAKHGIGVSSGTDALILALMALEIGPGDEVICPTFTFFATAGSISRLGATPVFVDSCPKCFNINVDSVARAITSKTKAVIPVHLFGQSAEMDGIIELASNHGLKIIEDGAQALGAKYKGRPVGGIGDFGTFSFFPSKNLGGFGDGGMVVTSDDGLAERARILRAHGSSPKYFHKYVGGNFRLDPLQAALLSVKLPHYDEYTKQRQANAEKYTSLFLEMDGFSRIDSCADCVASAEGNKEGDRGDSGIVLPATIAHCGHIWNQYTIQVKGGQRDALREHLASAGIGSEIYYPRTMDRQECFSSVDKRVGLPVAHKLSEEVLSLPIFPGLTSEQQETVVHEVSQFING